MSFNSDVIANELMTSLTAGVDFELPKIDFNDPIYNIPGLDPSNPLYQHVVSLTIKDLTEGKVDGDGYFDKMMMGISSQLKGEFDRNRITGAEYTKAYIAAIQAGIAGSIQFLLGKDAAFWSAQTAQMQAVTALIQMQQAKVAYAQTLAEAQTAQATYALTKLKLATEDAQAARLKFEIDNILPKQETLIIEQTNAQRGQTSNNRIDGQAVSGVQGKQKELYTQQITSYQRDSEVKAAKLFTDAWTVQKTIDEGLQAPNGFTNASVDTVLAALKINNNLN